MAEHSRVFPAARLMPGLILSICLLTGIKPLHAQAPAEFPADDAAFIAAFSDYLGKSKRDDSYEAAAAFTETFNGLSSDFKSAVKLTAAAMLKNKVRNYPVFTDYAKIVTRIASGEGNVPMEHIVVLKDLMESSKPASYGQFENFIEYLPDLMESAALYKTATRLWTFSEGAAYMPGVSEGKPYLDFRTVDIIAMTKNDTIRVYGTSGRCFPLDKFWEGSNGKYLFGRCGWSESEVSVELGQYKLDMDKADFIFDSVHFSMPRFLEGRVLGKVTEKLYSTTPETLSYPRFSSYSGEFSIRNLDDRVTTSGGFSLEGKRMIIHSTAEQPARIMLSTGGRKQAQASAKRFLIKLDEQEIVAENSAVILYMKKDSIYHPSLIFRYDMADDLIELQRSEGISRNLPYKSTYHEMDLGFNSVFYDLDSSHIDFRTISTYTSDPVSFTSYEHYVPQGELKYLTLTGRNPLQMIRELADSYGSVYLSGDAVAGMMGYPLQQIENILYKLTQDGFIYYDPESKQLVVDNKTFHYTDAGTGQYDFDHIRFYSNPRSKGVNGTVSVDSQAIRIRDVQPFDLSVIKRVTLTPGKSDVLLTEDRDLDMAGKLTAGKLEFKGRGMHFDYEGFKVDMREVDTLQIYVKAREMDSYGEFPDVPLKSVISGVKGTLYVEDPGNRSGLKNYPEYPYFQSYDTCYVYFDDNYDSTLYPRDKFYFAIYPFELDSITKTITDSLSFFGQFISGEIFNPFETYLSVQRDLTLGVDEFTPDAGLALYKGAGAFYGNYKLRNDGLFGDGRISYRHAEMESEKFEFYVDSLYARLDSFFISGDLGDDVAQASIGRSMAYWKPYQDSMFISKDGQNFRLYDRKLTYDGNLAYKNGRLFGVSDTVEAARHRLDQGRIQAQSTSFGKDVFSTEDGILDIFLEGTETVALNVSGVDVRMNMTAQKGTFITVADSVITTIPGNSLISNFHEFEWDVEGQKVTFVNNETLDYFFTSTLPAYDSLEFNAASAVYDIVENKTIASGVTDIPVADSKLIPPGNQLTIQQGGTIEPMSNATLVFNREEEMHRIENADLIIRSRNDFSGTGNYYYQTATGDPYTIIIDEIKVVEHRTESESQKKAEVDVSYTVQARGIIPEDDMFRLDEQLFYKGNAYIYSDNRDIEFVGFGKLDLKQNEASSWFNLNQGIDPGNFSLSLDSLIDETRRQVVAGLFVSPGELEVYSAVMNPKRSAQDPALLQVEGSLFKGEYSGEYLFGMEEDVRGEGGSGTVMKFNDNTGVVEIDGHITWVSGIPLVNVAGFGRLKYDPVSKTTKAVSAIGIDFPMDESIWYQLPRDIIEYQDKISPIEYNRPEIKRMFRHFIPKANDADMVIGDIEAEGYFQLPSSFPYKILLTDVELNWDPVDGNFKSTNVVGICAINSYPVDLRVPAYIEFGYSLGTNYMNIYFETSSGEWYYFNTKRGTMYVLSSDQAFNEMVVNSDNKEVRDDKKGPVIYEFQPGNLTSKLTFIARFEDYLARLSGETQPSEGEEVPGVEGE